MISIEVNHFPEIACWAGLWQRFKLIDKERSAAEMLLAGIQMYPSRKCVLSGAGDLKKEVQYC